MCDVEKMDFTVLGHGKTFAEWKQFSFAAHVAIFEAWGMGLDPEAYMKGVGHAMLVSADRDVQVLGGLEDIEDLAA